MKCLLGTSAYVNPELLEKCTKSWPKLQGIETAVYFDGYYYPKIFKTLIDNKVIESTVNYILKPEIPDHVGCSGGWNRLLQFGFDKLNCDYVIVVGSDTCFRAGFLEAVIRDLESLKPDFAVGQDTIFNCWMMNRRCYDTVGLWDENFFPAYFEDGDYHCRIKFTDLKMIAVGEPYLFDHYGSAVIKTNKERSEINHFTFVKNEEYFKKKWKVSGKWEDDYRTPYNMPNLTIKDWIIQDDYHIKRKVWKDLEDKLNNG